MNDHQRETLYQIAKRYLQRKHERDEARRIAGEATEDFYAAHAELLRLCKELDVTDFELPDTRFTVTEGTVGTQRIKSPSLVAGLFAFLGLSGKD